MLVKPLAVMLATALALAPAAEVKAPFVLMDGTPVKLRLVRNLSPGKRPRRRIPTDLIELKRQGLSGLLIQAMIEAFKQPIRARPRSAAFTLLGPFMAPWLSIRILRSRASSAECQVEASRRSGYIDAPSPANDSSR